MRCEESPRPTLSIFQPGRIVWPQVRQICTSQTEKFSRYTLILYFSPIQYWRNCRKICQTVSDRPKIMKKFSQPADENGHVLLPGISVAIKCLLTMLRAWERLRHYGLLYGLILWWPITRKIWVAQKNVIEEMLLEIKRSSPRVYIFSRFVVGISLYNYRVFIIEFHVGQREKS